MCDSRFEIIKLESDIQIQNNLLISPISFQKILDPQIKSLYYKVYKRFMLPKKISSEKTKQIENYLRNNREKDESSLETLTRLSKTLQIEPKL